MSPRQRILVVDDEATLCEVLKMNLELEGYAVDTACSAEEALALDLSVYDLLLLDVMMGDISGIAMARIIKKNTSLADIPIIFCTARDADADMIEGLETGADDYVTKPYNIRNLMLRVRSVLRRSAGRPSDADRSSVPSLSFEGLTVDTEAKHCTVDGEPVRLPQGVRDTLSSSGKSGQNIHPLRKSSGAYGPSRLWYFRELSTSTSRVCAPKSGLMANI